MLQFSFLPSLLQTDLTITLRGEVGEIHEMILGVGKALCVGAAFSGKAEFLQVPFLSL